MKCRPSDSPARTNPATQGQKPARAQLCLSHGWREAASRFVCGHDMGEFTVGSVEVAFEEKRPETGANGARL